MVSNTEGWRNAGCAWFASGMQDVHKCEGGMKGCRIYQTGDHLLCIVTTHHCLSVHDMVTDLCRYFGGR